jgi:hypothetical protein
VGVYLRVCPGAAEKAHEQGQAEEAKYGFSFHDFSFLKII